MRRFRPFLRDKKNHIRRPHSDLSGHLRCSQHRIAKPTVALFPYVQTGQIRRRPEKRLSAKWRRICKVPEIPLEARFRHSFRFGRRLRRIVCHPCSARQKSGSFRYRTPNPARHLAEVKYFFSTNLWLKGRSRASFSPWRKRKRDTGFALLTSLMLLSLLASLVLALHLSVSRNWSLSNAVEGQLHSTVLAENGIEYARAVLPHLNLQELFTGPNGRPDCLDREAGRDPLPLSLALSNDPATLVQPCDDGLPALGAQILWPEGQAADSSGTFLLRFSNNPEEDPFLDRDREVVVRSLGVVRSTAPNPFLPDLKNHVTVIEARFRQERSFDLPGPLVLAADAGEFEWNGLLMLQGEEAFAIALVGNSGFENSLRESMTTAQQAVTQGAGPSPSIVDSTLRYQQDRDFQALLTPSFWRHFEVALPEFADSAEAMQSGQPGLYYLPGGGRLEGILQGVFVARGELVVAVRSEIRGLIVHLGEGPLRLERGSRILGGVWMSNFDIGGSRLLKGPVHLQVDGPSQLRYETAEIEKALSLFPPTQLGWRFLYQ